MHCCNTMCWYDIIYIIFGDSFIGLDYSANVWQKHINYIMSQLLHNYSLSNLILFSFCISNLILKYFLIKKNLFVMQKIKPIDIDQINSSFTWIQKVNKNAFITFQHFCKPLTLKEHFLCNWTFCCVNDFYAD